MKTILLVLATLFITTQYKAQNNEALSAEQMAEWRRIAHEEGQKTVVGSTIKNFFRNKLILSRRIIENLINSGLLKAFDIKIIGILFLNWKLKYFVLFKSPVSFKEIYKAELISLLVALSSTSLKNLLKSSFLHVCTFLLSTNVFNSL